MSKYANSVQANLDLAAHGTAADNTNLAAACIVPAGKEIEIYNLQSFITTGSGASDTIELVRSDDATTPLCDVDINTTGVNESSASFPIVVSNTGSSDIALVFRSNGALGSPVGSVIAHFSKPAIT
ncbi:MAG: hypothetical protein D6694_12780 [Gammaproteobacteria bacterium]|nr:MAG: hypothetical protein D6694_12780 [Gammaproteobacteria bacterium]